MTDLEVFEIDDLVVDIGARQVSRGGKPLKLPGLTFDLLIALIRGAPAIVSYDQLAQEVWNGRPVSQETIAQRAKMLRDALEDDAKNPRYVEPVRGQGYRLIASSGVPQVEGRRPGWAIGLSVGIALCLLAAMLPWLLSDTSKTKSIAVLPFVDLSLAEDQQHLADGVATELINQLSRLEGLQVASRTASFFYREPIADFDAVARELGVATILEGSLHKTGNDLRVNVQLIDVSTGYELWSAAYDREVHEVLRIQSEIASSVAGALGVTLGVGGVNEFAGAGTRDYDAYEAYLEGDFDKAVAIDPNYAAAWAQKGLAVARSMWRHMPNEAPALIDQAIDYTSRAMALDPNSAQIQADFATQIYVTLDWHRAHEAYQRSLSLRRTGYGLNHFANMLARTGRLTYASLIRAEALDLWNLPPSTTLPNAISLEIALARFDSAASNVDQLPEHSKAHFQLYLGLNRGNPEQVRDALRAMPKTGAAYAEFVLPVLARLDRRDETLEYLRTLAANSDVVWPNKYELIALFAAYLNEPEFAWHVFERDVGYTTIRFILLWHPVMSEVRKLPEFKQFVVDANLVDYWRDYGWPDYCWPLGEDDFTCAGERS